MKCPVCEQHDFESEDSFDICPICGWENDGLQASDHNYAGGANSLSVNEARIEFFLLNCHSTSERATQCKDKYAHELREIYKRYAKTNRVAEPKQAEQKKIDFKYARRKYVDTLNSLLQNIVD